MKPIPLNGDTKALAESLVWFEPAVEALADPVRFLAHAFARATHEQMKMLGTYVSEDELRETLDKASPGIIDPPVVGLLEWTDGADSGAPQPKRRLG